MLLAGAAFAGVSLGPLSASLDALGLSGPAEGFIVDSSRKWGEWPKGQAQWTVSASSGDYRLRLQAFSGLGAADADQKRELQLSRIRLLYAGDIGYPGMITRSLKVPEALSPQTVRRAGKSDALLLPASAALTYGVGSDDLVVYRAALSFIYCPQSRRLFQLEWFAPKAAFSSTTALARLDSFACGG